MCTTTISNRLLGASVKLFLLFDVGLPTGDIVPEVLLGRKSFPKFIIHQIMIILASFRYDCTFVTVFH